MPTYAAYLARASIARGSIAVTPILRVDHRYRRPGRQVAAVLGVTVTATSWRAYSMYGPTKAYAEIYDLSDGRQLIVSKDDDYVQAAVMSSDFDWSGAVDVYDEQASQIAICEAAGITPPLDLREKWRENHQ